MRKIETITDLFKDGSVFYKVLKKQEKFCTSSPFYDSIVGHNHNCNVDFLVKCHAVSLSRNDARSDGSSA